MNCPSTRSRSTAPSSAPWWATSGRSEIVQSILLLGKGLGIDVVAEGVENVQQVDLLRKLGCERAQGYFFARPVPLEQLSF